MGNVFVRLGKPFLAHSANGGDQFQSSMLTRGNGGFQLVWTDTGGDGSGTALKAQVFEADGTRFRTEFVVNANAMGDQRDSETAELSNGFNIVVWTDDGGRADGATDIKAQYFDGAGTKYKTEFLVNTATGGSRSDPVVAPGPLGGFLIAWVDGGGTGGDASGTAIKAQLYKNDAIKVGGEFLVNTAAAGMQDQPAIAAQAGRGYMIAWRDAGGGDADIRAQLFDTAGVKVGAELLVNAAGAGEQDGPAVLALGGGNYLVSWTDADASGGAAVKARMFDAGGAPVGGEFAISGGGGTPDAAVLSALSGGGFLAVWTDAGALMAQAFDAAGARIGAPSLIADAQAGAVSAPSVATLAGGSTLISWTQTGADGGRDVFAQTFQFAGAAPIEGGEGPDVITGTADADFIYGLGGDDVVRGGGGADVIDGGDGNDRLFGEAGNDIVMGGAGNDYLEDRTVGMDRLDGGEGDDTIIVARSNDPVHDKVTAIGGAGNDRIRYEGGGTDLTVDAGIGADTVELAVQDAKVVITLGEGRDTLLFDTPAPILFRSPTVEILDFEAGAGGDTLDIRRLVSADPFFAGELQLAQSGADVTLRLRTEQGFIDLVMFRNESLSDLTSENFAGLRLPEPMTIGADGGVATNAAGLIGDPAVRITGDDVRFTNLAGAAIRPSAPGASAIVIEGAGAVVVNAAGATIGNAGGAYTAITGSAFADTVRNFGVVTGLVQLGAGDDLYYKRVSEANNMFEQPTIELGAGDDTAEFDIAGMTLLNTLNLAGGEGKDRLVIRNIEGDLRVQQGPVSGIEEYRLFGTGAPASITFSNTGFSGKPVAGDIYLSPGLHLIVPNNAATRTPAITAATGNLHLEGGSLTLGHNVSFAQVIGSAAAETVTLSPGLFRPLGTFIGLGNVSLAGGDDRFVWNSYQPSPGNVDGGEGRDVLRVGQDTPVQSLAAFINFEIIDHFLSNGFTGNTYRLTGIGATAERLLFQAVVGPSSVEIDGVRNPNLVVGAGGHQIVVLATSTLGRIADRALVDPSQAAALDNRVDNRGAIAGGVDLGGGNDLLINSGAIGGDVDLGAGDDTYAAVAGGSVAGRVIGGAGNDLVTGGDLGDFIDLGGGGDDTASGGGGDDGFYLRAALTAADRIDGGAGGDDQLALQGDYAGLTFGVGNLVGIETLVLLSGSDARFGDMAGATYGYRLTSVDANVAAGGLLRVNMNGLRAGENVMFDGSAEVDGTFLFFGGAGVETLTGGQGDDGFYFGTALFGAGDRLTGGAGDDQLGLQGDYAGVRAIVFGADQLVGVESIVVLSGADARFGGGGGNHSYDLTLNNGNTAAGATLTINGNGLRDGEALRVNAGAETNGVIRIFSGGGADVLTGGAGADQIFGGGGDDMIRGGLGADALTGGAGDDLFVYLATADSTAAARDRINDFGVGDRIDLSAIDANTRTGGNQAFMFVGADIFSGAAGELRVVANGAGGWTVEADANGDRIADFVLNVASDHAIVALDFLL